MGNRKLTEEEFQVLQLCAKKTWLDSFGEHTHENYKIEKFKQCSCNYHPDPIWLVQQFDSINMMTLAQKVYAKTFEGSNLYEWLKELLIANHVCH